MRFHPCGKDGDGEPELQGWVCSGGRHPARSSGPKAGPAPSRFHTARSAAPAAHSPAPAGEGGASEAKEKAGLRCPETALLRTHEAGGAAVALAFLGLQLLPRLGSPRAPQGSPPRRCSCREQQPLPPRLPRAQREALCSLPAIYLRSKPSQLPLYHKELKMPATHMPLPIRFDWRDKNVVTKVRNQQMCGGCWAFSVVGGIESAYAIKGESLEDLSVQQVIDCSYNNFGCSGGSTVNALNWLNKTQVRLVRDSEYSFKAQTGLCHYFSGSHAGVSIKGYSSYDFSDKEDEMAKVLLAYGPLAVIVDAISWQDYLGGIIQHHCSSGEANHAVLITGFDKTGNTPYWIVRNSWGTSWGVDGYAFVKMGANICGIADSVSAVFV
uniref:Cathepsin O n=1 Tax=Sarcophilus harrisii TaxID=9305 RepID=A0A7N4PZD2_SARHA